MICEVFQQALATPIFPGEQEDECKKSDSHNSTNCTYKLPSKKHHRGKNHRCPVCRKSFKGKVELANHMPEHWPVKFKCSKCPKICSSEFNLSRHKIAHHPHTRPHKCDVCLKTFIYKKDLKVHLGVHADVQWTASTPPLSP